MPSYLVTGASRGLGLAFVTELLKSPENVVVATARDTASSKGLQELKIKDTKSQLKLVNLDVAELSSINTAVEKVSQLLPSGLDYLVSNAGVSYCGMESFENIDLAQLEAELVFTVTAPINLIRGFLPLIRQSHAKKIMIVTSSLGSINTAAFLPGLANGYSVARAALNMMARKWSTTLKSEGITLAMMHPGWIGTTEIGDGIRDWVEKYHPQLEELTAEKSATDCMKVLNELTSENAGAFFNHDGTTLPF